MIRPGLPGRGEAITEQVDLQQVKDQMFGVYERQANTFDKQRDKSLFEKAWLDRFLARLPDGGTILDVGCGSGEPIASYLIERGYNVTGADYSPAMLAIAKVRWPKLNWINMDMREWQINERYDGVIAWNSLFHLSPEEQRDATPNILQCVGDGGAFLTTIGTGEGETDGWVGGERVYHGSLSETEYRSIMSKHGFHHVETKLNDSECRGHSVLLAVKDGGQR